MIKPQDIDFTDDVSALLSYEKARFAGYDLDAATAPAEVIEDNENHTVLGVKLTTPSGREIVREVKAFKNPDVPPSPLQIVQGKHTFYNLNFNVSVTDGPEWLSGMFYCRPAGSEVEYTRLSFSSANGGPYGVGMDEQSDVMNWEFYFEVTIDEETLTSPVGIAIRHPMVTIGFANAPEVFHEYTLVNLTYSTPGYVPAEVLISSNYQGLGFNAFYNPSVNGVEIMLDRKKVAQGTEIELTVNVDYAYQQTLSLRYDKTDLNANAVFTAGLSTEQDFFFLKPPASLAPGDVVYAILNNYSLVERASYSAEILTNNMVATTDLVNPFTLVPGQVAIVPILIESVASSEGATLQVQFKNYKGDVLATTAVVPGVMAD